MVENKSLLRFIVDEAHCIDMWGQNFRPSYSELGNLKQFGRPIAAFTGTATNITKQRIVKNLGLVEAVVLQSTCNWSNLIFNAVPKNGPHAKEDVVKYVQDNYCDSCGIVYCCTTKDTVELAYIFKSKGMSAVYYHGKLDFFEKNDNAKAWLSGKASVMCATSAFGMGINKPDVRFVVHLSLSKSLEEYYEEAGRAGRDRVKSNCTLMYRFEDRNKLIQLISKSLSEEHSEFQMNCLNKVVSYCLSLVCRRKQLMEYFDNETEANCNRTCDNCLKTPPAIKDYTNEAINVCHCVQEMLAVNANVNVKQVALAFKGSKSKCDIESKGFHVISHYGSGRNVFNNEVDAIKFVQHLIVHGVLLENIRAVDYRFTTPCITLGKKAQSMINREKYVFLTI
jgi:bloom syndrome protein